MIHQLSLAQSPRTSLWLVVLLVVVPNDLHLPSQCAQVHAKAAKPSGLSVATLLIGPDTSSKAPKPRSPGESEHVSHFDGVPSFRQPQQNHSVRRFMWTQLDDVMDAVAQGMVDGMHTMKRIVAPDDRNILSSFRYMPGATTVRYIIRKPVPFNMPPPPFPPMLMYPTRRPIWYDPAVMHPQAPFNQNYKLFENFAFQDPQMLQQSFGSLATDTQVQEAHPQILVPTWTNATDSTTYNDWTPGTAGSGKVLNGLHTRVILPDTYTTIPYDVTEKAAEESVQYLHQHFNSSDLHVPNERKGEQTYVQPPTQSTIETNQTQSVVNYTETKSFLPAIPANNRSNHQFYLRPLYQPVTAYRTVLNPSKLTYADAIRYTNNRGVLKFGDRLNKITV